MPTQCFLLRLKFSERSLLSDVVILIAGHIDNGILNHRITLIIILLFIYSGWPTQYNCFPVGLCYITSATYQTITSATEVSLKCAMILFHFYHIVQVYNSVNLSCAI